MQRTRGYLFFSFAALALAACAPTGRGPALPATASGQTAALARGSAEKAPSVACAPSRVRGAARCFAIVAGGPHGDTPSGYGPLDLQDAYRLPPSGGTGQTVAVVDAFDDPTAENDLAVYRSTFGLPQCSSQSHCFAKVNQRGQPSNFPAPDSGWALEISVDVDMVSAACANCGILLVEADSPKASDLGAAAQEAAKLGAVVVSNSYGVAAGSSNPKWYHHRGALMVGAAGDAGSTPAEPAAFPGVVAVGGTALVRDPSSKRRWSETPFGSGGCTTNAKPPWQHDNFCSTRTTNDVAAVASPSDGVAVYDSYQFGGFVVVGGTSVSTPFVAGVFGLAGNAATLNAGKSLYQHHRHLFAIAPAGYDEATGEGTPDGIGAF